MNWIVFSALWWIFTYLEFLYFENINGALLNHLVFCVSISNFSLLSVCVSPIILVMRLMRSHCSLYVCLFPFVFFSFSVRFVSFKKKVGLYFCAEISCIKEDIFFVKQEITYQACCSSCPDILRLLANCSHCHRNNFPKRLSSHPHKRIPTNPAQRVAIAVPCYTGEDSSNNYISEHSFTDSNETEHYITDWFSNGRWGPN